MERFGFIALGFWPISDSTLILILKWILILAIVTASVVSIALESINLSYTSSKKDTLPGILRAHFNRDFQDNAYKYLKAKTYLSMISDFWYCILSVTILQFALLGLLDGYIRSFNWGQYITGVVFFLFFSFIFLLSEIPFRLFRTFVIEQRFGFNKSTFRLWIVDFFKELCLSLIIGLPLLLMLFFFVDSAGRYWWFFSFLFLSCIQLFLAFVYPVWIAPLFNKFSPMEEGTLKSAIEELAHNLNFDLAGIYIMDGSRRSSHANAFFVGFGKYRRVVLFDTLVEQLSVDELLGVLAHEIGHAKLNHVKKSMVVSFLISLIGFWFFSLIVSWPPLSQAFGFKIQSFYGMLTACLFLLSPLSLFLAPLSSLFSRHFEYEADAFAVKASSTPSAFEKALIKISEKSLSNLNPHPLYSFFYYS
ncbi:MAG: M48 family metallopeptidase, partial [SAR324 cluster bacterium]|nr:M48 family metallopeptidase [SAR324 cluster bacterium]